MKAIVTGGAGFIGSHLSDFLISQGATVTVIDNLSTGNEDNLNPNVDFIQDDINSSKLDELHHHLTTVLSIMLLIPMVL